MPVTGQEGPAHEHARRDTAARMTAETAPRLPVDLSRLTDWMARAMPEVEGPLTARQFAGGQSNPTYRIAGSSGSWVLRRKPGGKLLPKTHMIEREYRVMAALAGTEVPVPAMRAWCGDPRSSERRSTSWISCPDGWYSKPTCPA